MGTRVVHCKKEKYDVLIDRTTIFGNPFRIDQHRNRRQAIEDHKYWLLGRRYVKYKQERRFEVMAKLASLRGKVLGCWCSPLPCHGDTLAAMADVLGEKISMREGK